ncbi:hypothetical protein FGO68_gene7380 [Halteria grandinella]|uniref:Uncharacterized protein n=1 Tax=Halteria grandinella TaxID=5974 RepID=A0A8J8P6G7_HALGN|nr:hypothetical protein FGO68_gene7380 [Halteria grandinella]
MFNPYTIQRYPNWNPQNFEVTPQGTSYQTMIHGAGSIIFNIHNGTNQYSSITLQSVQFSKLYHRPQVQYFQQIRLPCIMSTIVKTTDLSNLVPVVTIKNVTLKESTNEQSYGFFELQASSLNITNFSGSNIGKWNMTRDEAMFEGWDQQMRLKKYTAEALFKLRMFRYVDNSTVKFSKVYVENSRFSGIDARLGSLPLFQVEMFKDIGDTGNAELYIMGVTLEDSKRGDTADVSESSIFLFTNQMQSNVSITISELTIQNTESIYGIFKSNALVNSITIQNSVFIRSPVGLYSFLLYLPSQPADSLSFTNCTFKDTRLSKPLQQDLLRLYQTDTSAFEHASMIRVIKTKALSFDNCQIQDLHQAANAAFIEISQQSEVTINNSIFKDISASRAGAIILSVQSTATIIYSQFLRISAFETGVIQVGDRSQIIVTKCFFEDNAGVINGVFKISGQSQFYFQDVTFAKNKAHIKNSVGQISQMSIYSSFINVVFIQNQAWLDLESDLETLGTAIEVLVSDALIDFQNCTFEDNQAFSGTPNLLLNEAQNIKIVGSLFRNTYDHIESSQNNGGFISIVSNTVIRVLKTKFLRGRAIQGGAIFSQGPAEIYFIDSQFTENTATQSGGAIYADSFSVLKLNESVVLRGNQAGKLGDGVYAKNALDGQIIFQDIQMSSDLASNYLYVERLLSVKISSCQFQNNQGYRHKESLKAGGLHIKDAFSIDIRQSIFENLWSKSQLGGGAIALEKSDQSGTAIIINSTFKNCSARTNGGAISLNSYPMTELRELSVTNNKAARGGGIYFAGKASYQCVLNIDTSSFQGNRADIEGGAIKWKYFEPYLRNVAFSNNSAKIYGDNIASVAKNLVMIEPNQMLQQSFLNESSNRNFTVSSGGSVDVYFALVDKNGIFVRTDNSSQLIAIPMQMEKGSQFQSVIETSTTVTAVNGYYYFQKLTLVSQPNSSQKIMFETAGIDLSIPGLTQFGGLSPINQINISISVEPCKLGEELIQNGRCKACGEGYYLLISPTEPTQCLKCQELVSQCPGGSELYPLAGYWRSSNSTDEFLQCINTAACLSKDDRYNNSQGQCASEYQGILCANCKQGFSKTYASNECLKCPSQINNILLIVGTLILLILIVIILVRSNLSTTSVKEKNYLPVFFRILLNHIQFLTLIASFDLDWPSQLLSFYSSLVPVSEASTQLASIDCLLQGSNLFSTHRLHYIRAIFLAILPIAIAAFAIFVWQGIFLFTLKRKSVAFSLEQPQDTTGHESMDQEVQSQIESEAITQENRSVSIIQIDGGEQGKVISTIIVILFLMHPSITREMFSLFNCKNIEGISRLYSDLETVCYQGDHFNLTLWVAGPSFLLYSIGIPTFGFLALTKFRDSLSNQAVKQRFGFLYNGYREGFASYWEIVAIYCKVIIIFIQIFLLQSGKITQALVTLIFLVLKVGFLKYIQPYSKQYLNKLEIISTMSSAISVYFSIFFISGRSKASTSQTVISEQSSLLMFMIIVLSQCLFFIYWIYSFITEFRITIRKKYPRLYTTFFLCCKKEQYLIEREIDRFNEKLAPFTTKVSELQKYIDSAFDMYQKNMIPNEDKKLREYIIKFVKLKELIERDQKFRGENVPSYLDIDSLLKKKKTIRVGSSQTPKPEFEQSNHRGKGSTNLSASLIRGLSGIQGISIEEEEGSFSSSQSELEIATDFRNSSLAISDTSLSQVAVNRRQHRKKKNSQMKMAAIQRLNDQNKTPIPQRTRSILKKSKAGSSFVSYDDNNTPQYVGSHEEKQTLGEEEEKEFKILWREEDKRDMDQKHDEKQQKKKKSKVAKNKKEKSLEDSDLYDKELGMALA